MGTAKEQAGAAFAQKLARLAPENRAAVHNRIARMLAARIGRPSPDGGIESPQKADNGGTVEQK